MKLAIRPTMPAVGLCGAFLACVAYAQVLPCYVQFDMTCAELHADTSRVCTSGQNSTPCGDIIIDAGSIPDVGSAPPGQAGKRRIDTQGPSDTATIHKFHCDGSSCVSDGIQEFTCQGRELDEDSGGCTGGPS